MPFPFLVNAFTSGEISPSLYARTDIEGYKRGAAEIYNAFVDYHGGVLNRAGTRFLGVAQSRSFGYGTAQSDFFPRLIPFIYEQGQSLIICMEHFRIRFIWQGGFIVENAVAITGITKANPGVVTAVGHGYSSSDQVFITGVGGMTEVNGRYFNITVIDADHFNLQDIFTGANTNTTGYGTYTSGGNVYKIYTVASPYDGADVWTIKFVQSRDVMTFTTPLYPPYHLTRFGNINWVFSVINFESKTAAPTGVSLNPSMTGSGTEYSYVITAVNRDSGEESEPSTEETVDSGYWTLEDSVRVTWNEVTGADFYTIYRASVVKNRTVPAKAIYGQIGQSRGLSYNDGHDTANWELTPPKNENPFNATNKYPASVTYVQQRAAFAASIDFPYRVWLSPTGAFDSMNKSLPPRDTDAVQLDLASQRADPISNMLAMPAGVLCTTTGGIYHVYGGGEGEPITPSNVNIDLVSSIAASFLTPINIDLNVLFTQAMGSTVQNLLYNFSQSIYESFDLSILSTHFFAREQIVNWTYSNEPHKIIWAVRSDGKLLSLTYLAEQKIFAWALHETEGFVKDVCAIPEENEDAVYIAVDRPGLNITCYERMASRVIVNPDNIWYVDSGQTSFVNWVNAALQVASSSGNNVSATSLGGNIFVPDDVGKVIRGGGGLMDIVAYNSPTQVLVNITRPIINVYPSGLPYAFRPGRWTKDPKFSSFQGMHHMEGKQVYGTADGNVVGPLTVTNGVITLPEPASRVILGIKFQSRIKTLPVEFSTRDLQTVQTKRKNVEKVTLRLVNSRAVQVGPDYEDMETWQPRLDEWLGQPPNLVTGDQEIIIGGGWNDTGQICIKQDDPLPMQVSGIYVDMDLGDT